MPDAVSPAVSRAMSQFQNRLFAVRKGQAAGSFARAASSPARIHSHLSTAKDFARLRSRINANTVLLAKLRDRQIDPATMPAEFCRRLAEEMDEPLENLAAHLSAPPEASGMHASSTNPKANRRSRRGNPSTEAVRGSGLSPEQRRRLLSFRD